MVGMTSSSVCNKIEDKSWRLPAYEKHIAAPQMQSVLVGLPVQIPAIVMDVPNENPEVKAIVERFTASLIVGINSVTVAAERVYVPKRHLLPACHRQSAG